MDNGVDKSQQYLVLENDIRNKYASVVWSHKIQEKQADIYSKNYKRLETTNIISASLTSVGIVSLIFTDQLWVKIVSAILSFVTIFVSSYFKAFNLSDLRKRHKASANQLLKIRDKLEMVLLEIRIKSKQPEEILQHYKELSEELHKCYDEAPPTTDKAVDLARKALNVTKDNSFSDDEIDSFLPETLRRG